MGKTKNGNSRESKAKLGMTGFEENQVKKIPILGKQRRVWGEFGVTLAEFGVNWDLWGLQGQTC